MEQVVNNL